MFASFNLFEKACNAKGIKCLHYDRKKKKTYCLWEALLSIKTMEKNKNFVFFINFRKCAGDVHVEN